MGAVSVPVAGPAGTTFGQESRLLGVSIPGPDLSRSAKDAWDTAGGDPIGRARRKAAMLEKALTTVGARPTDADARKAVLRVAKASAQLQRKPVIGRTFLMDDEAQKFLVRKVGCALTAAQVAAFLDKVPDYSDASKDDAWLTAERPVSRQVDAVFLTTLISALGEAHRGVILAKQRAADARDAGHEAQVHRASRPKSAPGRVRAPVSTDTTAFWHLKPDTVPKKKVKRPRSAKGGWARDTRTLAYARDIAGWSILPIKRPRSALPKRSADARLNNLVAGAHIIDLGPRKVGTVPLAPLNSPARPEKDAPQTTLEAHGAAIAKLQAVALRHEHGAVECLDGATIDALSYFVERRFHVRLTGAEARSVRGLARDGTALQATLRELATVGCRRSPRVLLSGLLSAMALAPGGGEALVALGGDLAAKASQGSIHATDRLEKIERATAWAARRAVLYEEERDRVAVGLRRLQRLVRAELDQRFKVRGRAQSLREAVKRKPATARPSSAPAVRTLKKKESNLKKLRKELHKAHERKAQQQVLSKLTEAHARKEHKVFKELQARSQRIRATMHASQFASLLHAELARDAAAGFATSKTPVKEEEEDDLGKRLAHLTTTGSPASSDGEEDGGSPHRRRAIETGPEPSETPAPPLTKSRRSSQRSTRSSRSIRPAQGPFGVIATSLAAEVINNCVRGFVYRCLRKKMTRAQTEWQRWMEKRAHRMMARVVRDYLKRSRMRQEYLRVQSALLERDRSQSIIERCLMRKVRRMRALKAGLTGTAYAFDFVAEPLADDEAAMRMQKRFRAIHARATSSSLQHAREQTRAIRVEVVKARGLRVADERHLNQHGGHASFIGGAADPRCYVSAQLGERGGFGPLNAGAPSEAKERIERQYDILAKRQKAIAPTHTKCAEKREYLEALDKAKATADDKVKAALSAKADIIGDAIDRACLLKMRRNTLPFWIPPIIRARDWGNFASYPSRFPLFRAKTKAIAKTLDPTWNAAFDVHGVDPDSTVTFTVADIDEGRAEDRDDFMGQVTIRLSALRHADFLAQMTYESERRTKEKNQSGWRNALTPKTSRRQNDGALLLMDARARLGPNLVPVSDRSGDKVRHVAFDDIHIEATGAVYYRIWAAPRAKSCCGHLEVKVQRGFVVSFWKPVWACLAFGHLTLRDHRGDPAIRLDLDVRHIEEVDVHAPELGTGDGDTFSLVVAGGKTHCLRVGDLGAPFRDMEHQAWVRRLRRCAPRISTNEYADSACPLHEYVDTRRRDGGAAARRASLRRRAVAPGKGVDPLAGLGDFLAMNG